MADLSQLESAYDSAKAVTARAEAEYQQLKNSANSSNFKLPEQEAAFLAARKTASDFNTNVLQPAKLAEDDANSAIQNAKTDANAKRDQGPNTVSAGELQTESATAKDDGASSQSPAPGSEVLAPTGRIEKEPAKTQPSNADTFDGGPQETIDWEKVPSVDVSGVGQNPDELSPSDDAAVGPADGRGAANATQAAINKKYGGIITPQTNILDKYASYTYAISIYLMSPEDFQRMLANKTRYISGFQLLIQSGGAPQVGGVVPATNQTQSGGAPANNASPQAGRNQFFPLDFYIDNLKMTSYLSGKGSRGAHNATELNFKIIEPSGITLLERLYNATQQYVGSSGAANGSPQNYAAQNYLLAIRFYGYDAQGNLVQPSKSEDTAGISDKFAITEKFIPFRFNSIKFRIANRLTEYECQGNSIASDIGLSQARGVIPYNIELTATTLKELFGTNVTTSSAAPADERETPAQPAVVPGTNPLTSRRAGGNAGRGTGLAKDPVKVNGSNSAPPKANAAPTPSLLTGLVGALNKFQAELVDKQEITYADEFEVVIVEPEIQNARLRPPGTADKGSWGMLEPTSAAQAKDGTKQTANANSKNVSATAGMPIIQFIDLCVRNSTYIYDQQTKIKDPVTNKLIEQGAAQTPAWYKISVESKPLKYDPKRNDYAYKTTYQINIYRVSQIYSDYFPEGRFYGTHKKYDYWYTGQNTSILKFEQDFNYLYYQTVNTAQTREEQGSTTDYREYVKKIYSPNSPESSQGSKGDVGEPGANAADYLYSPGDQARVKLDIVGDPAWIQQGEIWQGVNAPDVSDQSQVAFLKDGTINYTSQEVLFEVAFNKPSDYNSQTGLMDIKRNNS